MVELLYFLGDARTSHEPIILLIGRINGILTIRCLLWALFCLIDNCITSSCVRALILLATVLLKDSLMTFIIGVQIASVCRPTCLSSCVWAHSELLAVCRRCCCNPRRGLSAWAHAATMLDGALLWYLGPTANQVRDTDRSCRVHLVLHET